MPINSSVSMRLAPWAILVIVVTAFLAWGGVAQATHSDVRASVVTPVPVPVFGLRPKAFLPVIFSSPRSGTGWAPPGILPPGSALPTEAQCAARVREKPENKRVNATYNATPGNQQLGSDIFSGDDPRAYTEIGLRVTGHFAGTTDEILQWAACKWGFDGDILRAQAALESWWHQDAKGDWGIQADRCPPGHGPGVDDAINRPDTCPESWGLLQTRYPYEQSAWPGMADSTAFEVDTAGAIWRACYEGYESWLNQVARGKDYGPGDEWGCVGRWYAGRWRTAEAEYYIARVKGYLNARVWEQPYFQEP